MGYKDILVYVDHSKSRDSRVEAAAVLAEKFEAHLTGLCLVAASPLPNYYAAQVPSNVLELVRQQNTERAERGKAEFDKMLKRHSVASECRIVSCNEIQIPDVIGLHGRYSDLIVLSQISSERPLPVGGRQMVEQVVMSSGRPVLVVPYIGWRKTLGERITVAWDGGRESARAVSDALPLLMKANEVTLLVINPHKGNHGEEPGADIGLHLARHGVKAEVRRAEFSDVDTGNAILSQVADLSSDLLVMGAYGHSRLRELVVGGVTRTVFEEMTVPVLMSH